MNEQLDDALFRYQDRIIKSIPSDYNGKDLDWEMNVIIWMSKVRELILDGTFSPSIIEFITQSLEKRKN